MTPRNGDGVRAQTPLDFLVGMSVFLLAVGFVLAFVPAMFEPFTTSSAEHLMMADRAATHLVEGALVEDPARPTVLHAACTAAFFAGDSPEPEGCRFASNDTNEELGLVAWRNVNVTIEQGGGVVTVENTPLHRGPSTAGADNLAVSQRTVLVDGERAQLRVRVW